MKDESRHTEIKHTLFGEILSYFWMLLGAFIAAAAIHVFFIPNRLIDGGIVGLAMITGRIFGNQYIPFFLVLYNVPFLFLAYKNIGRSFVANLIVAVIAFSFFLLMMPHIFPTSFTGEHLEVVVIGGAILGTGLGLIIRSGACLDGT